jgi:2-octaprenyl-6-methoxyphenol hydroxylase
VTDQGVTDVLIAGGGPVGAVLALGLRGCGASVLQVRSDAAAGDRPIALSYGSRLLLEREGAWPAASPTPINEIHVSQQGGFGRTLIRAADCDLPALGYVAAYSGILAWLSAVDAGRSGVEGKVIDWKPGAHHIEVRVARTAGGETLERARLLVLADGGHAGLAESGRDYGQLAVVAEVQTERPHRNIAWERFTRDGPIALLPYQNRHALIWCIEADAVQSLLALPEAEFLLRLGAAFGRRAGPFLSAGPRASFPLSLRHRRVIEPRTILVGNAAQTLHPVAGQGLNLGLRDAVVLAELIASTHPRELGSEAFLKHYAARRRLDRVAGIRFTDTLVRLFSNSRATLGMARGAGLAFLDILPPARAFLARRMIYGARALP